jgi:hypothetical protein
MVPLLLEGQKHTFIAILRLKANALLTMETGFIGVPNSGITLE